MDVYVGWPGGRGCRTHPVRWVAAVDLRAGMSLVKHCLRGVWGGDPLYLQELWAGGGDQDGGSWFREGRSREACAAGATPLPSLSGPVQSAACHLFLTAAPILQMRQGKLVEGHIAGKQGSCDRSRDHACQTTEPEFDHCCLHPRGQVLAWAQRWESGVGDDPCRGAEQKGHKMGRDLPGPGGGGQRGRPHRGPWEGPQWTGFQAHMRHPLDTPRLSLGVSEIQPHVAGNWQASCIVATVVLFTHTSRGCWGVWGSSRKPESSAQTAEGCCREGGALGAWLWAYIPRLGPPPPASVSTSVNGD